MFFVNLNIEYLSDRDKVFLKDFLINAVNGNVRVTDKSDGYLFIEGVHPELISVKNKRMILSSYDGSRILYKASDGTFTFYQVVDSGLKYLGTTATVTDTEESVTLTGSDNVNIVQKTSRTSSNLGNIPREERFIRDVGLTSNGFFIARPCPIHRERDKLVFFTDKTRNILVFPKNSIDRLVGLSNKHGCFVKICDINGRCKYLSLDPGNGDRIYEKSINQAEFDQHMLSMLKNRDVSIQNKQEVSC